eukprot:620203-Rhodomonas_salina.1
MLVGLSSSVSPQVTSASTRGIPGSVWDRRRYRDHDSNSLGLECCVATGLMERSWWLFSGGSGWSTAGPCVRGPVSQVWLKAGAD